MRAIVFTSLTLGLIAMTGCQSNKVAYRVESKIGPLIETKQRLVEITIIEVDSSGSRRLASPTVFALQGQEATINVENLHGRTIACRVLFDRDKSSTSVSLSKKGRVFWSSEQTTTFDSEG